MPLFFFSPGATVFLHAVSSLGPVSPALGELHPNVPARHRLLRRCALKAASSQEAQPEPREAAHQPGVQSVKWAGEAGRSR